MIDFDTLVFIRQGLVFTHNVIIKRVMKGVINHGDRPRFYNTKYCQNKQATAKEKKYEGSHTEENPVH